MTDNRIAINEIFYSIQGEGLYVGMPMVFVRVAGCSVQCSWCDQPDAVKQGFEAHGKVWNLKYQKMTIDEIVQAVWPYPTTTVCLTGGEPVQHKLGSLVSKLKDIDYIIHMETSGVEYPAWVHDVDHITLSPKRGHAVSKLWLDEKSIVLKFIVDEAFSSDDVSQAIGYAKDGFIVYLQPRNDLHTICEKMLQKTLKLVQEFGMLLRFSPQLHRYLVIH